MKKKFLLEYWRKNRIITDERLLKAFEEVPRENFIRSDLLEEAYGDYPLPIGFDQTISQPFIIALSLPFGLVGAVLGLWIMGYPFGFMAFLGVVSLTGIVVNDAIVLIDFINVTREKEQDVIKAVIEAGKIRFRPVILTTVSTVGGLLPLAVRGGSLWGPMGNVIIFGLSLATILTLIIVPVFYVALERKG